MGAVRAAGAGRRVRASDDPQARVTPPRGLPACSVGWRRELRVLEGERARGALPFMTVSPGGELLDEVPAGVREKERTLE
jgi:hypothetical protein